MAGKKFCYHFGCDNYLRKLSVSFEGDIRTFKHPNCASVTEVSDILKGGPGMR